MPKFIFPSSYLCKCGYHCEFCENTIREMTEMSKRRMREETLMADDGKHTVVFSDGEWVALTCPEHGRLPNPDAKG